MDNLSRSKVDVWLITGATGLVGRFMLAELLRAGQHTAVIVREKTTASLSARIEEALAVFEENSQFGRPKLLAGDLTQPGLGLTERDREWLKHRRLGVIHCAASIRFNAESADSEPFLSNVAGTKHLIDVLESCTVDSFLYVSTAYVTSRAAVKGVPVFSGRRPEMAIARGAIGGNDYESSKILAEQMIADCEWLGKKTICRPSIIVGDSRTGYSSTFHGYYAPLKIGLEFVKRCGFNEEAGAWFRSQLGLNESDRKNFVPVDWVAKSIVHIARKPELQGSVYHLTNPTATTCIDVQKAIQRSLAKFAAGFAPPADSSGQFREQLEIYESYFNNDPEFDCKNTLSALPDFACPKVDIGMLEKLGDYAIRVNFGWPKPSAQIPAYAKIMQSLTQLPEVNCGENAELLELNLLGNSAPSALYFVRSENRWMPAKGSFYHQQIKYRMTMAADLLAGCISDSGVTIDTSLLVESGQLVFQGNPSVGRLVFINDWVQDLKLLAPLRSANRDP
jgi:thioester reductase-like protein